MLRKVLIADDNKLNREVLKKILSEDYEVLEAEDGSRAIELLRSTPDISAVLLDIVMPQLDGYGVLEKMHSDETLSIIPVIVTTANTDIGTEVRALSLGAHDFITKPYNPEIIKHRLKNTINLRETAAFVNAATYDKLTELYNREAFHSKVSELLSEHEPGYYVMACFDVDNFKLINDRYGTQKGDEILKQLAKVFFNGFSKIGGVCARITADNFAAMYPTRYMDTPATAKIIEEAAALDGSIAPVTFSIGRYIIDDLSLGVSAMYDRADIAGNSIKGRFDVNIAFYDEAMREDIIREQEIVNEMNDALKEEQFKVWLQPQYNHYSGALIGAEALVRWDHPKRGLIPPYQFIPIFERNGFIYEMDKYIWEHCCMLLRKWLNEGKKVVPVSVNISRYDLFKEDLYDVLIDLVKKYDIPVEYLHLEITESAFAESTGQIISVAERLIGFGFTVEIDDFGSGYSSLNTLKDVPAGILKLDMRFLEGEKNSIRGGNILQSIVRMAKWLGMPVIAEGVETIEHAEFLKSIGCYYVQGYLYAKPMPVEKYEELSEKEFKEDGMSVLTTVKTLNNNTFWDPLSMDTLIFNAYVGSACIFEYCNKAVEILRINGKYSQELFGCPGMDEKALDVNVFDYMDEENKAITVANILKAIETGNESTCETLLIGLNNEGSRTYLRVTVRLLARAGDRMLFYCSILNQTQQKENEEGLQIFSEQMKAIMEKIGSGVAVASVTRNGRLSRLFANDVYFELLGYTQQQYENEVADLYSLIYPEDKEKTESFVAKLRSNGGTESLFCRCVDRTGKILSVKCTASIKRISGLDDSIILLLIDNAPSESMTKDASSEYPLLATLAFSTLMTSTTDLSFIKDENLNYICCSRAFASMVGLAGEEEIFGKTDHDLFDEELAEKYRADDFMLMQSERAYVNYIENIPSEDGSVRYSNTSKYILRDSEGRCAGIYGTGRDVTDDRVSYAQLKLLTDTIPGGIARYEYSENKPKLLYFNDGFHVLSGYSRQEYSRLTNIDLLFLVFEEDKNLIRKDFWRLVENNEQMNVTFRIRTKSGACRWQNLKGLISEEKNGKATINVVMFDVTEQKEIEEKLRMSEEAYRLALKHSGSILCRYNVADRCVTLPTEIAERFGIPEMIFDVPGSPVEKGYIAGECAAKFTSFFEEILRGEKNGAAVFGIRIALGLRWVKANYSTIFSDSGAPVYAVISFVDITEERKKDTEHELVREKEQLFKRLAEIDGMTKLYNKSTTEMLVRKALEMKSEIAACALMIVDLDDLKYLNDTYGHPQGDRAICAIANALSAQFRHTDIIGRIGGDEFIVYLEGIVSKEKIGRMADALLKKISEFKIGENSDVFVSASIGIACAFGEKAYFDELYVKADKALYHVKRNGKNGFAFYSSDENS